MGKRKATCGSVCIAYGKTKIKKNCQILNNMAVPYYNVPLLGRRTEVVENTPEKEPVSDLCVKFVGVEKVKPILFTV